MVDSGTIVGLDPSVIGRWLDVCTEVDLPIRLTQLTGGYSNLTVKVVDASGREWVLRRPPLGGVLESAHDVLREHRIMRALGETAVPVPRMIGAEADPAVAGSPFFVMEYVPGPIVQEPEQALDLTPSERARAAGSLFEVLAAIHTVDLASCDLADLARHGGYVERQLRRWHQQYLSVRTRDLPHLEEVFGWLLANQPPETSVGLIHGDFRLDNVILGEDCSVTAVLDWELSTLGEPLADLGLTLAYWLHDGDDEALVPRASTVPGFPSRDEMAERYALATGAEIDNLRYYIALGHWKVACIAEGVYSRYMAGDMGEASIDVAHFERHPPARAAAAAELIRAGV